MRKQKGITLIALIITIVVLLILAVVAINSIVNDGIFSKAGSVTHKYSQSQIEEQVNLALNEWFLKKHLTQGANLKTFLNNKFENVYENADGTLSVVTDGYEIIVTSEGQIGQISELKEELPRATDSKVVANADGTGDAVAVDSTKEGTTLYITFTPYIKNGNITSVEPAVPFAVTKNGSYEFKITGVVDGKTYENTVTIVVKQYEHVLQKVNYNENSSTYVLKGTDSGTGTDVTLSTENVEWRLMEILDDGTILIVPSKLIVDTKVTLVGNENTYVNGPDLLDNICNELYGKGATYVKRARNMNVDDINRLSGFDPETEPQNADTNINNFLNDDQYGSRWRFSDVASGITTSRSTDGGATWSPYVEIGAGAGKVFAWGGNGLFTSYASGYVEGVTYKYTLYTYQISSYLNFSELTNNFGILEKLELLPLQSTLNKAQFWLSSRYEHYDGSGPVYGLRFVNQNHVSFTQMYKQYADGWQNEEFSYNLCPVVELDGSKVELTKVSGKWEITEK